MALHYNELPGPYVDEVVRLASRNLANGVIEEPRGFFDVITLGNVGQVSNGVPEVFVNGEQFPVRLLWASFALVPQWDATPVAAGVDPRLIQRVGARFRFHDTYYMTDDFAVVPLWNNRIVAASDAITQASSTIVFDRPLVLTERASLRVSVELQSTPTTPRTVSVSFTGTGMISKTPYFFQGEYELDSTAATEIDPTSFRSDGVEPIALTTMVVTCSAEEDDATGVGDIRQLAVNVRQVGGGTNADWWRGPQVPALTLDRVPAQLLGISAGTAVLHRFPGDGVMWEPGQGITVELAAMNAATVGLDVGVHLFGYISVV